MLIALHIARKCSVVLFMILALGGCSVMNTFSRYSDSSGFYKASLVNKTDAIALAELDKKRRSLDKQLYMLERGRIAQLSDKTDASLRDFSLVIDADKKNEERAVFAIGKGASQVGSVISNDSVIPYQIEHYERTMLHHYQALNYLAKKDLAGAQVEMRRANFSQKQAMDRRRKKVDAAQEKAKSEMLLQDQSNSNDQTKEMDYYARLGVMNNVVAKTKNAFHNAYTFYLSGVIFEALSEPNSAYIDYKKALNIRPDNVFIQNDVLRLAKQLGMSEDYRFYQNEIGRSAQPSSGNTGEVVVFYENDFVAQKTESRIDFPDLLRSRYYSVAMPVYDQPWRSSIPINILANQKFLGVTQPAVDFYALAANALREKIPAIVARQIARLVVKAQIQKEFQERSEGLGFLIDAVNFVSERADLRAWSTLPEYGQIARFELAQGTHELSFDNKHAYEQSFNQFVNKSSVNVNVKRNKITLVYLTKLSGRLEKRVFNL